MQPLKLLKVLKEKEDSVAVTPFCEVKYTYFDLFTRVDKLKMQIGQPAQAAKSSKFYWIPLLALHNQVHEIPR
jgi:hypothetical protein